MKPGLSYIYLPREDTWPGPPAHWPKNFQDNFAKWGSDPNWDFASGFIFEEASSQERNFLAAADALSIRYCRAVLPRSEPEFPNEHVHVIAGLQSDDASSKESKFLEGLIAFGKACPSCGHQIPKQTEPMRARVSALKGYDLFRPDVQGSANIVIASKRLREIFEKNRISGVSFEPVIDVGASRPATEYFQIVTRKSAFHTRIAKGTLTKPACATCGVSSSLVLGWITEYASGDILEGYDVCAVDQIAFADGRIITYDVAQLLISARLAKLLFMEKAKGIIPFLRKPLKQFIRALPVVNPVICAPSSRAHAHYPR